MEFEKRFTPLMDISRLATATTDGARQRESENEAIIYVSAGVLLRFVGGSTFVCITQEATSNKHRNNEILTKI